MPTRTFYTAYDVNQAGADEAKDANAQTCFGLPGSGGLKASMSSCHFTLHLAVYDNDLVYMAIVGVISDPVAAASDYTSTLVISPAAFTWDGSSGHQVASGGTTYLDATVDASDGSASSAPSWASGKTAYEAAYNPKEGLDYGWFCWNFPDTVAAPEDAYPGGTWKLIGHLSDFGAGDDYQNGAVWISGTGTYPLQNGIGPTPYKLVIPGFYVVKDYYPFAIRKSSAWASANRSGGSTTIRKTSWRDAKNMESGNDGDHGFYRSSGAWVKAPKFT